MAIDTSQLSSLQCIIHCAPKTCLSLCIPIIDYMRNKSGVTDARSISLYSIYNNVLHITAHKQVLAATESDVQNTMSLTSYILESVTINVALFVALSTYILIVYSYLFQRMSLLLTIVDHLYSQCPHSVSLRLSEDMATGQLLSTLT